MQQNVILQGFHEFLCELDYYKDLKDENIIDNNIESDENYQKITSRQQSVENNNQQLIKIPLQFIDEQEYIRIWTNLFQFEAKAQIIKAIQQEQENSEQFYLLNGQQHDQFYILTFSSKEQIKCRYQFYDLVIISMQNPKILQEEHLLAIVEQWDSYLKLKIKIDLQNSSDKTSKIKKGLLKDSLWYIKKLCNLVTLNREYQAIHSINNIRLKDQILNPKQFKNEIHDYFIIPDKLREVLQKSYNDSQFQAIQQTLKKEGITLIQGPPGTGKTTTVLGTLSVLLNSNNNNKLKQTLKKQQYKLQSISEKELQDKIKLLKPWLYKQNYQDWRDEFQIDEEKMNLQNITLDNAKITDKVIKIQKKEEKLVQKPEKILICAPSNAAIDEIVRKILEKGLLDEYGNRVDSFIIRVGPNIDRNLEQVHLDYLVVKEMQRQNLMDDQQGNVKNQILKQSKIVLATLSSAGSQILIQSGLIFDTVIIDEAAQAVEIQSLIPLKYQAKRLILIGDPKQLPATIFSKKCQDFSYDQSIFQRFQISKYPVHMLNIQYRMHPIISQFISQNFYNSQLLDCSQMIKIIGPQPIYNHMAFQQFMFYHCEGQEKFINSSFTNQQEIDIILQIYQFLKANFNSFKDNQLGIISPYSQQVLHIKKALSNLVNAKCPVEVNSVDGFQGREKDIIIYSSVRSQQGVNNFKQTIGFLRDKRRMNVSLSRARICLIVIGNIQRLRISNIWRNLIKHAQILNNCFDLTFDSIDFLKEIQINPKNMEFKEKIKN